MLSIKNKLLTDSTITNYPHNEYAIQLRTDIEQSQTFIELLNGFLKHSISVHLNKTNPDYLNSCDGDYSPLSIFVYEILKPEHTQLFGNILSFIRNQDDYARWKWIINEINLLLLTNPVKHMIQTELFILHPIIGESFSFWGGDWIDEYYYISLGLDMQMVDQMYTHFLTLYTTTYLGESMREITVDGTKKRKLTHDRPINEEKLITYFTLVKTDIEFRKLNEKSLPMFYEYMYNTV